MRVPFCSRSSAGRRFRRESPAGALLALALIGLALVDSTAAQITPDFIGPPGSAKPFLTATASGGLLLTWFEPGDSGRVALRIAAREGGRWSDPRTVAAGDRFFVNWADFPSAVETATGAWAVHWLERTEAKSYAYGVRLSRSLDRGITWSWPVTVHADRSAVEHGFVAMSPSPDGSVAIAWLDGRQMASDSAGAMSLRAARIGTDGRVTNEALLDPRTCDCCQVAMARTDAGLVAAYRDRSAGEVRDIAVVRELGGRWSAPTLVHADGWVIRACPVNGPSIDALEQTVAVAWYTMAGGRARVNLAVSSDGGLRFGRPLGIDDGRPLGRVQVRLGPAGEMVVVWLEAVADRAEWRVRVVRPGGGAGPARTLGTTERTRAAGFARAAVLGGELFVAWAEPGDDGRVVVSRTEVR